MWTPQGREAARERLAADVAEFEAQGGHVARLHAADAAKPLKHIGMTAVNAKRAAHLDRRLPRHAHR